jgi:hypothetical protein
MVSACQIRNLWQENVDKDGQFTVMAIEIIHIIPNGKAYTKHTFSLVALIFV